MAHGDVLDDSQPQPRAACLARAAAIHAVKTLRKSGNVLRCNPDAAVPDTELHMSIGLLAPAQYDFAARRGISNGIGHQVDEGAVQLIAAAADPRLAFDFKKDLVLPVAE